MTTPTQHWQVPEALIDLIDAYAETRHRCGGIYNARTEAARKAVIEALSGVQALSAAPGEPSDAEIEKLAAEHLKAFAQFTGAGDVWVEGEVAFARAVLAKFSELPMRQ